VNQRHTNFPKIGDFIESFEGFDVPVDFFRDEHKSRDSWFTYMVNDGGLWFLDWQPKTGYKVYFDRDCFDDLTKDSYVNAIEVVNIIESRNGNPIFIVSF
jgi:hypothetical protein